MKKHLFPFIAAFLMLIGAGSALVSCKDATADAIKFSQDRLNKIKIIDDSLIRAYLTRRNYGPGDYTRTDAGLYLVTLTPNLQGTVPKTGKQVAVKYIGSFVTKEKENIIFDSSITGKTLCDCLTFVVGSGSVIGGWDTGVPLIHQGERKLLLIPSYLAYGGSGSPNGGIGPNTPLVFDMEVIAVSK